MKYILLIMVVFLVGCQSNEVAIQDHVYWFPDEHEVHEGTWLQWPHDYTYGQGTQEALEPIWIEMTKSLSLGENVHIVVYDFYEKDHVFDLLEGEGVDMEKIDFFVQPIDDVWARDNGPIFVYRDDDLVILDWDFNGWGNKVPYKKDAKLRQAIGRDLDLPVIDLDLVLEGGSIELDSNGTGILTRSSVINDNRNPNLSEEEVDNYLKTYYNLDNIIWLDGVAGMDITDFHIDGFVKFLDKSTIITMDENDLSEWALPDKDIETLYHMKNSQGKAYDYVYLPLTAENVVLDSGEVLDYKGSYVNYYVANAVVLVPVYNDINDQVALDILESLYPKRKVIGIDVRELYKNGGMIHCVTQQQPK